MLCLMLLKTEFKGLPGLGKRKIVSNRFLVEQLVSSGGRDCCWKGSGICTSVPPTAWFSRLEFPKENELFQGNSLNVLPAERFSFVSWITQNENRTDIPLIGYFDLFWSAAYFHFLIYTLLSYKIKGVLNLLVLPKDFCGLNCNQHRT